MMTATHPQTLALLALSRGSYQFRSPSLRRALLRRRWIMPWGGGLYVITDAGRDALAGSRHLAQAQRELGAAPSHTQPSTGYRSDSVKRSVRR
jgi:hypothetical protein